MQRGTVRYRVSYRGNGGISAKILSVTFARIRQGLVRFMKYQRLNSSRHV